MMYLTELGFSGRCERAAGTPWYRHTTTTIITEMTTSRATCKQTKKKVLAEKNKIKQPKKSAVKKKCGLKGQKSVLRKRKQFSFFLKLRGNKKTPLEVRCVPRNSYLQAACDVYGREARQTKSGGIIELKKETKKQTNERTDKQKQSAMFQWKKKTIKQPNIHTWRLLTYVYLFASHTFEQIRPRARSSIFHRPHSSG